MTSLERGIFIGAGTLVLLITVLLGAAAAWVYAKTYVPENIHEVAAPARGDRVLSAFYSQPKAPPSQPGTLLRQQALDGPPVLTRAGDSFRLLYSSTEGLGGARVNAVSGALYLPAGEPPPDGWPLLVWSHGTVGIGDVCAPSYAGHGERDRSYLNPWLEQGYAIAASDYQGLGTVGTHPYMDARTMAYNNLDLIRAIQSADFPLSKKVVIAGQSQGATGALATASYGDSYAPAVDLGGVIATGIPYFSLSVALDIAVNSDRDEVSASLPLSLYMLTFAEMLDPDFQLDAVISDVARPVSKQIDQSCVFDFIDATQSAGLSVNKAFTTRPDFELMKVFSRAQVPTLGFKTPVFAGSGTLDKITPYSMQQAYIEDACAAGANILARTYSGANHNQALLRSTDDAHSFADTVLSGGSPGNTCAKR